MPLLLLAERGDLLVLDLRVIAFAGRVAGVDVEPVDASLAAVGLLDGGVEDADGAGGDAGHVADVAADAVAAEQADDRVVGDLPAAVGVDGDAGALAGGSEFFVGRSRHGNSSGRVESCNLVLSKQLASEEGHIAPGKPGEIKHPREAGGYRALSADSS